jgi:hypothetical protein
MEVGNSHDEKENKNTHKQFVYQSFHYSSGAWDALSNPLADSCLLQA